MAELALVVAVAEMGLVAAVAEMARVAAVDDVALVATVAELALVIAQLQQVQNRRHKISSAAVWNSPSCPSQLATATHFVLSATRINMKAFDSQ